MSVAPAPELPAVLTVRQIAERWAVSEHIVRTCINSGELAGFRIGPRLMRVRTDKLDEFERRVIAERMTPEEREVRDDREARRDFQWRLIKSAMLRRPKYVNAKEARAAETLRQTPLDCDGLYLEVTQQSTTEILPRSTLRFEK